MSGKTWWIASIGGLVVVLLGAGIWWGLVNYYHPLSLIHTISRQNVTGYLEWRKQDQERLFSDQSLPLPALLSQLDCQPSKCTFWGANNALVQRTESGESSWELYLENPNQTILNANWENMTQGRNELLVEQERYHLVWRDDIAIISTRTAAQIDEHLSLIDDMPWVTDGSWSIWGHYLAVGYCSNICLWQNWQKLGTSFPLLSDFVQDSISYSSFTIKDSDIGPAVHYKLNFTASYHAATNNQSPMQSISIPSNAQLIFSGTNFDTTINDIFHDTQNKGLWKTIVDFSSSTPTGIAMDALSHIMGKYQYTISLDKQWQNTTIGLAISADAWPHIKDTMTTQAQKVIPILFPQKQSLVLPDGSTGYEWVKNNDVSYSWEQGDNTQAIFSAKNKKDGTIVIKIYTKITNNQLFLSLQPIKNINQLECRMNGPYQEFNAWHYDANHWWWEGVTEHSLNSVRGVMGWSKNIPHCVQN